MKGKIFSMTLEPSKRQDLFKHATQISEKND